VGRTWTVHIEKTSGKNVFLTLKSVANGGWIGHNTLFQRNREYRGHHQNGPRTEKGFPCPGGGRQLSRRHGRCRKKGSRGVSPTGFPGGAQGEVRLGHGLYPWVQMGPGAGL